MNYPLYYCKHFSTEFYLSLNFYVLLPSYFAFTVIYWGYILGILFCHVNIRYVLHSLDYIKSNYIKLQLITLNYNKLITLNN